MWWEEEEEEAAAAAAGRKLKPKNPTIECGELQPSHRAH